MYDSKNRSSRGLRVLSLKVKDIVSEKKRTTYKDVAETLIHELNDKMKADTIGDPTVIINFAILCVYDFELGIIAWFRS